MDVTTAWITDLTQIQPGDRIEVWEDQRVRYVGAVSQVAPHLGVLWILEAGLGASVLISTQDHRLRWCQLAPAA